MEVSKAEEKVAAQSITMEDVTGLELNEAKRILKELGLEYEIANEQDAVEGIVVDQLPKKGIMINVGTKVILYTN